MQIYGKLHVICILIYISHEKCLSSVDHIQMKADYHNTPTLFLVPDSVIHS